MSEPWTIDVQEAEVRLLAQRVLDQQIDDVGSWWLFPKGAALDDHLWATCVVLCRWVRLECGDGHPRAVARTPLAVAFLMAVASGEAVWPPEITELCYERLRASSTPPKPWWARLLFWRS